MPIQLQLQYIDLIKKCYDLRDKYREDKLTAFWGRKGSLAKGDLMVVGRAVNGWDDAIWDKDELQDPKEMHPFVVQMRQKAESSAQCPMHWINEYWQRTDGNYNVAKSHFWQAIKGVALGLGVAVSEDEWPSRIMWTNLYKVSPFDEGNPSTGLLELQREHCGDILRTEIGRWFPKRILMLTDIDWALWFLQKFGATRVQVEGFKYVQWVGKMDIGLKEPAVIVVTSRPEGKPREPFVSEIMKAFELSTAS